MRSLVVGAWYELRYGHTSTMDTLSRTERSERMALIRGRDTKPELAVRRLLHRSGFRYRLHRATLPGKPDLVFPSRHKVIFVHGCFWHRHPGCALARLPKSRLEFWLPKLKGESPPRSQEYPTPQKARLADVCCLGVPAG
jgi:DNA mismatch endonuclease (patch repair protein)